MGEITLAPVSDTGQGVTSDIMTAIERVDTVQGLDRTYFANVTPQLLCLLLPGVKPREQNIPNTLFLGAYLAISSLLLRLALACYVPSWSLMLSLCWDTSINIARDGADPDEACWQ